MAIETKRIAKAVYSIAEKQDKIVGLADTLQMLSKLYKKNHVFRQLLVTRRISLDRKLDIFRKMFNGAMSGTVYSLLQLLIDERQSGDLPKIAKQFQHILEERSGLVKATAFLAVKLDVEIYEKIKQNLKVQYGDNLKFSQKIESSILGGLKLRIGNTIIDGSISNQLKKMRNVLAQS